MTTPDDDGMTTTFFIVWLEDGSALRAVDSQLNYIALRQAATLGAVAEVDLPEGGEAVLGPGWVKGFMRTSPGVRAKGRAIERALAREEPPDFLPPDA